MNRAEQLIEEFTRYIRSRTGEEEPLMIQDEDLQKIFQISRTTLYRARSKGALPYSIVRGNLVMYDYDAVLLAVKTGRFKVKNLSCIEAVERLETYKKLLSL